MEIKKTTLILFLGSCRLLVDTVGWERGNVRLSFFHWAHLYSCAMMWTSSAALSIRRQHFYSFARAFLKMSGVTTARITASWISCARRTPTVQMMSDLVSGAFKEFLLLFFICLFIHALDLLLERLTFRWRVKCCVYRPFDSVFTVSVWTDCRNFWGKSFCVSYQHFPQHSLTLGCSTWYISGGCRSGRVAGRLLFVPICF